MKITHRAAQQLAETVARIIVEPDQPPTLALDRIIDAFCDVGMVTTCPKCERTIMPGGTCRDCDRT